MPKKVKNPYWIEYQKIKKIECLCILHIGDTQSIVEDICVDVCCNKLIP